MSKGIGVGVGIDLTMLNQELLQADKNLNKLIVSARETTSTIQKAFNTTGTDGVRAFVKELSNASSILSQMMKAGGNIKFDAKNVSAGSKEITRAVDQVNIIVNQTRDSFERLNATKLRPLIDAKTNIDSISQLEARLALLKERLNTGTFAGGRPLNDTTRINTANEIAAIQERLNVLRMSTAEFQKLKAQEGMAVLEQAQKVDEATRRENEAGKRRAEQVIANYNKELKEARRAYSEKYRMYEEMFRKMALAESRARASQYQHIQGYGDTSNQAMAAYNRLYGGKGVQSINNMEATLAKLRAAQDKLNLATEKGRTKYLEIDNAIKRIQNDLKAARGETDRLTQSTSRWGNMMTVFFAAHYIRSFVNNLITVRGEFELQHRSLQILVQDVDKANEIWDKTVALAVKSPFRVKELVSYTKQLAAYRVEADKLYETNKMLADVSAGLGVDMSRLILAFGQVKAANFLRGTELRQFSEAGVNMLDELAKRFSAIEGRAVSVGEVFERVSKRMVSFKDVEAVFKTITSKGGVFYQMQEKQAETTRGMVMNLKDSFDLMFDEIGQDNDSIIKKSIQLVRELVREWRKFKPAIETAGIALMTFFGAWVLKKIVAGVEAIFSAFNTNPVMTTITLVATLATFIWRCVENTDALTAAMNRVDVEVTKQLQDSIALYHELAEEIRDVTTTTEERNEAMTELKTKFGDILPDQYLELEYIRGISDNYDAATDAMMNYYNSKAIQQKKDKIETEFNEELEGDIFELINSTYDLIDDWSSDFTDREKTILKAGVPAVINKLVEDIKSGTRAIPTTNKDLVLIEELAKWANVSADKFGSDMGYLEDILDLFQTLSERQAKMSYIAPLPSASWDEEVAAEGLRRYKEYIAEVEDAQKNLFELASKFSESPEGRDATEQIIAIVESLDLPDNLKNQFQPLLLEYANELFLGAKGGEFEFKALSASVQEKWQATMAVIWSDLAKITSSSSKEGASELADLMWNESEKKIIESELLALTDFQKEVNNVFRDVSKDMGVDKDLFKDFVPDSEKAVGDLIKDIKSLEGQRKEAIEAWDKVISEGADEDEAEKLRSIDAETIKRWRKEVLALAEAANRLGYVEKDKGGRTKKDIQERIKVVDDMHKKYEELNKTLSESESLEGAFKAYQDAFATAYKREDVRKMTAEEFVEKVLNFPNEEDVVKWFDRLKTTVADRKDKIKVELAKGKFVMDLDVRLKKDADEELKKQIEEMFDRYDTTKEFDKLRAPKDFLKNMFGIDAMSLPQLRFEVEARESEFIGTDMQKDYEKFLEKIDDLERKELEEKAKRFVDYLSKNLDAIENVQRGRGLDIAFAQQLFDEGKISAELFGEAVQSIVEETNKEISKLNLDKFKESPEYIQAMGDMTAYSASELRTLSERLKAVIAENGHAFSAEELKVYHDAIEKVNKRLIRLERPFVYDKDIRNLQEIKRLNEEVANEKEKEIGLNQKLIEQEIYRDSLVMSLEKLQKDRRDAKARGEDTTLVDAAILQTQRDLEKANDDVEQTEANLNHSKGLIAELGAELNTILNNETEAFAKLTAYVNIFNKSLDAFTTVFNDVKGVVDSFGVDTKTGFWAETSVAIDALMNVGSKAASAATKFASGDIFGGVVDSVGAIFEAIKGVNETIDATYESTITAKLKEIEDLGLAYEKLEKGIEDAYNAKDLAKYNEEMKVNIDLQLKAYEAALKAEEAKKDTDPERVKELTQSYKELSESWEESKKSQLEDMGGVTDFRDATSGFVDAWYDAFQETGNGLDGLRDNFRDFFKDVVKQQALTQGATAIMSQLYETINKSLEGDYTISDDEYQNIDDVQEKVLSELDAFLKGYYERYGDIISETEGGKLSELQKGIQGVTEQTAQVLEALLNSMRDTQANAYMELQSQTKILRDIYGILQNAASASPVAFSTRLI